LYVDLSGDEGRFLRLRHAERISISPHSMEFLPNGDLILVSLNVQQTNYKIYLYSIKNKPTTNTNLWKYSQVLYDIEISEGLKEHEIHCFVYQTKLINMMINY
jgi:hypothetical protein